MQTLNYDIIIIGGGLAGLSAANTVATLSDAKIAIIEGRGIGSNNPTPMTFTDLMERFDLEAHITGAYTRFTFHSPLGGRSSHKFSNAPLVAYNYKSACQDLFQRSQSTGNITLFQHKAADLQQPKNGLWHLRLSDKQQLNAPLIIDASGRGMFSVRKLNLPYPTMFSHCLGQKFSNCPTPDSEEVFFLAPSNKYGDGGGWLYPLADNKVSFGYATLGNTADFPGHLVKQRYQQAVTEFKPYANWFAQATPEHPEAGIIPICPPKRFVYDGLMLIGDAVGQATIWSCMGSEPALVSGQLAGEAAVKAYHQADYSKSVLEHYQREWNRDYYQMYRQGKQLAGPSWNQSDESWNRQIPLVQQLTPEQMLARLRSNWPMLKWWQIAFIRTYDWAGRMRRGLMAYLRRKKIKQAMQ